MAFFKPVVCCYLLAAILVAGAPTNHTQPPDDFDLSDLYDDDDDYGLLDYLDNYEDEAKHQNTSWCTHDTFRLRCVHGTCVNVSHCECDEGWTGMQCDHRCTLKCHHGKCKIRPAFLQSNKPPSQITEEDMICFCDVGYTSAGCSEKIPDRRGNAEEDNRKLAIILGTCLSVVVFLGIILPLVVWFTKTAIRKRKFDRYKNSIKTYEETDGKSFDAYISYSATSNAAQFVNELLTPRLLARGFEPYIPRRDLSVPEDSKKNEDIIATVNRSRRTIVVLTRDYIANKEWQKLEPLYTDALNVYLEPQVIAIALEDLNSQEMREMPASLQYILEYTNWLKVPECWSASSEMSTSGDKMSQFWSDLEIAMPKRKKDSKEATLQ